MCVRECSDSGSPTTKKSPVLSAAVVPASPRRVRNVTGGSPDTRIRYPLEPAPAPGHMGSATLPARPGVHMPLRASWRGCFGAIQRRLSSHGKELISLPFQSWNWRQEIQWETVARPKPSSSHVPQPAAKNPRGVHASSHVSGREPTNPRAQLLLLSQSKLAALSPRFYPFMGKKGGVNH